MIPGRVRQPTETRERMDWHDRGPERARSETRESQPETTTTMDSEQDQNDVKGELPLATQTVRPRKAWGSPLRRRAIGVGVFLGVVLWFVHKRRTFAPEPWLEGSFDPLGHGQSDSLAVKEAEELFL